MADLEPPRVQAVIVSFDARECLLACLDALARRVRIALEVTVVDNASHDDSAEAVRQRHPTVRLIANPDNLGFSAACNQGWRAGRAPFVLFLNPDAEVGPGAVEALAAQLEARGEVGIVGPLTRFDDGTIQVSTGPDLTPWSELAQRRLVRGVARRDPAWIARAEARHASEREVDWVSGACLMARREVLRGLAGFDEGFFLYEEDADLCRRARRLGCRVLFTPAAEVRHRIGRSMAAAGERPRLEYHRSHLRYYAKHDGLAARLVLRLALALHAAACALRRGRSPAGRAEALALLRLACLGR